MTVNRNPILDGYYAYAHLLLIQSVFITMDRVRSLTVLLTRLVSCAVLCAGIVLNPYCNSIANKFLPLFRWVLSILDKKRSVDVIGTSLPTSIGSVRLRAGACSRRASLTTRQGNAPPGLSLRAQQYCALLAPPPD